MPVISGVKSPSERFAGAEDTFTIEALMQNGWALQAGTSHFLGQNFAKAFEVFYQTESNSRELVWATSWGVSTRLLGAMLMVHSDDRGVLLPPRVAPYQIVIVPIYSGSNETDGQVESSCYEIQSWLENAGVRVKVDDRKSLRHGAKYYEWERKGVPLRLDIGRRDIAAHRGTLAQRITGEKRLCSLLKAELIPEILNELEQFQANLFRIASERLRNSTFPVQSYNEMKRMMETEGSRGFYLAPWKNDPISEEQIKLDCKATIRCFPFEYNEHPPAAGIRCFYSGEPATHYALFARAF